MSDLKYRHVTTWSISDVAQWLEENHFTSYIPLLCHEHRIDGQVLVRLTLEELKSEPLSFTIFGDIKRLHMAILKLRMEHGWVERNEEAYCTDTPSFEYEKSNELSQCLLKRKTLEPTSIDDSLNGKLVSYLPQTSCKRKISTNSNSSSASSSFYSSTSSQPSTDSCLPSSSLARYKQIHSHPNVDPFKSSPIDYKLESNSDSEKKRRKRSNVKAHRSTTEFKPEIWKALLAMAYFTLSTWITTIVMVIVHDRVPDMQTYPPLPDLILDNLPLIPWAFDACELCGLALMAIWTVVLVFHKHRFILLRRMFSLFGSVFLIRCVTMLITSLSVPGRHLECRSRVSTMFKA